MTDYAGWFSQVTGLSAGPHEWQRDLAAEPDCRNRLIHIPTGLGKTEGVLCAWLYHAVGPAFQPDPDAAQTAFQPDENGPQTAFQPAGNQSPEKRQPGKADVLNAWPRRLVWCLPMRVLVEQTAERARTMIDRWAEASGRDGASKPKVHILMGGEQTEPWYLDPERRAVLIGTQDMLLSRALNRGYASARARWNRRLG